MKNIKMGGLEIRLEDGSITIKNDKVNREIVLLIDNVGTSTSISYAEFHFLVGILRNISDSNVKSIVENLQ